MQQNWLLLVTYKSHSIRLQWLGSHDFGPRVKKFDHPCLKRWGKNATTSKVLTAQFCHNLPLPQIAKKQCFFLNLPANDRLQFFIFAFVSEQLTVISDVTLILMLFHGRDDLHFSWDLPWLCFWPHLLPSPECKPCLGFHVRNFGTSVYPKHSATFVSFLKFANSLKFAEQCVENYLERASGIPFIIINAVVITAPL